MNRLPDQLPDSLLSSLADDPVALEGILDVLKTGDLDDGDDFCSFVEHELSDEEPLDPELIALKGEL